MREHKPDHWPYDPIVEPLPENDDLPIDVAKPDPSMQPYDWFLVVLFVVLVAYFIADSIFGLKWI